jgi:hypothetical protein
MTKGDAYKAYYEANKERILEANKERAKEKRIQLREAPEEEKEKVREKQRAKTERLRVAHYTVALDELATLHKDNEFGSIFKTLTKTSLGNLTPSMFEWLCQMPTASANQ